MIPKAMSQTLSALLFLAVSAGMAAIWFSAYSTGRSIYQTPPDTAVPPVIVSIADRSVEVPRGGHRDFPFVLPSHLCRITGRVGGQTRNAGYSVLLLNDTAFTQFRAGQGVTPYWDSGKAAASKLDLSIMGPGTFHLFVTNESGPSARPITVQAQAICP